MLGDDTLKKTKKQSKNSAKTAITQAIKTKKATWTYEASSPMGGAAGEAYTNTLAASGMHPASVLAREAIQNSVDAHAADDRKVKVEFVANALTGSSKNAFIENAGLLSLMPRKDKLGFKEPNCLANLSKNKVPLNLLYINDYNTTGLEGDPENPDSKFFRLLLSLGDGGKEDEHGTGGSYGFGKSVYCSNSGILTIFAYSKTQDHKGQPMSLLFGCGYFRKHKDSGKYFTGRAWYGVDNTSSLANAQQVVTPLRDAKADAVAAILGFKSRGQKELGTSVLIVDSMINTHELLKGIEESWWPRLVSNMLDVSVINEAGESSLPRPRKRNDLKPFIDAFEIATGVSPADNKASFKKIFIKVDKDNIGTIGLIVLKQNENEEFPVSDEHLDAVALIRSTLMVVSYHRKWTEGTPPMAGAFLAHDEIDDILRASEPPAHNEWDRNARRLQDSSGHKRQVVDRVLTGIKRSLKDSQKAASPPPPPRPKRLTIMEKTLASLLSGSKRGRSGVGGGEVSLAPIHLTYDKEPAAEVDGQKLRLTAVFSVRLKADEDVDQLEARLRVTCPVVEDNELGESLAVSVVTTEKIKEDPESQGWKRITIRRDRASKFMCETESYDPSWTVQFIPEVEPVKVL